ncbi:MAG: hypothetical protein F6K44_25275 [Moorea sp. SIO3E2]|uniref:hypothetical protein n=1 Tax=Moorena sp. SIO4E2 TaxID=2607826 RepID=UPI001054F5D2|nr:hypothetical protein [Moorena sp. SIO4E2]NEQ06522.1 hypothetical protein [Moorena sp. SIO4E2]NEQ16896.1 hypothetical protein [Moorena sp. SIO3E2]NES40388.1 hypothetical protein [Moorena sp. SIO2C4]
MTGEFNSSRFCKHSAVSSQQSAVSGQRSAYFIQKHRLRYAQAARTVGWHRLRRCDLTHKLIANS